MAVELKMGKFKAVYKGQMELYLRWLEKYEMEKGEQPPLGNIGPVHYFFTFFTLLW